MNLKVPMGRDMRERRGSQAERIQIPDPRAECRLPVYLRSRMG